MNKTNLYRKANETTANKNTLTLLNYYLNFKTIMNSSKAEVFITAFKTLPKRERKVVIEKILQDKQLREDLIDTVLIEQRKNEPSRSLDDYLKDRKGNQKQFVHS